MGLAPGAGTIDRILAPFLPVGTESTIESPRQAGVKLRARDFQQLNSIQSTPPTPHTLSS